MNSNFQLLQLVIRESSLRYFNNVQKESRKKTYQMIIKKNLPLMPHSLLPFLCRVSNYALTFSKSFKFCV